MEHPQTNRQGEATNKMIIGKFKKRLDGAKRRWVEELVEILWAYRCTPQSTTQEIPFRLTYGIDAKFSIEVREISL